MFCLRALSPSRNWRGYAGRAFSARPDRFCRVPFRELTAFCLCARPPLENSNDSAEFHSEERQCFACVHFLPVETGGGMPVGYFSQTRPILPISIQRANSVSPTYISLLRHWAWACRQDVFCKTRSIMPISIRRINSVLLVCIFSQ